MLKMDLWNYVSLWYVVTGRTGSLSNLTSCGLWEKLGPFKLRVTQRSFLASCVHSTGKWSSTFMFLLWVAIYHLFILLAPACRQTNKQTNKQGDSFPAVSLIFSVSREGSRWTSGLQQAVPTHPAAQLRSKLTPPTFLKFTQNQLRHAWFLLALFQKVLFHTDSSW